MHLGQYLLSVECFGIIELDAARYYFVNDINLDVAEMSGNLRMLLLPINLVGFDIIFHEL